MLEFGFLGILIRRAFLNASLHYLKRWTILLTLVLGVLYAISDEIHQSYVPGRETNGMDLACDSIGIFASLFVRFTKESLV